MTKKRVCTLCGHPAIQDHVRCIEFREKYGAELDVIADLETRVTEYIEEVSELKTNVERLEEVLADSRQVADKFKAKSAKFWKALLKWGKHDRFCSADKDRPVPEMCSCGLDKFLNEEK